jgi:hypothetical protein
MYNKKMRLRYMQDWRVAIPSLGRVNELGEKSLATLEHHGISKDIIDIFCIAEEIEQYRKKYPGYNIIEAPRGMKEVRNFIFQEYYNEGDWIVSMDDDILKMIMKNPNGWEKGWAREDNIDLKKEINLAFTECVRSKRSLWGLYPVGNYFFMKNEITYDYKFCNGGMWGTIINKDLLKLGIDQYEDYERCIRHYIKEGGMVRLNYLHAKTPYEPAKCVGGMGTTRKYEESRDYLTEHYPNLFGIKQKKSGPNPFLKDSR